MKLSSIPENEYICSHLINGKQSVSSSAESERLVSPYYGKAFGKVSYATPEEIETCVLAAEKAAAEWGRVPLRERTRPLFKFRDLIEKEIDRLAALAALEAGKTTAEAKAGIAKGLEIVEFALSLENLDSGAAMEVSRGVTCQFLRVPRGVCLGITPFNFPAMVPMWLFPIAVTLGNAFILKPSEKVPATACELGRLMMEAGYPAGVFSVLHGSKAVVEQLIDHPAVRTIAFVGSTAAAKSVYHRATALDKRALCLGGAKNHILLAPDADPDIAIPGIVDSFTGCAGQRCMAASVLVSVGDCNEMLDGIIAEARKRQPGRDLGAIIDEASLKRISAAISQAEKEGATIALDGRNPTLTDDIKDGYWLAPTILDHTSADMNCWQTEIFGPVLTIIRASNLEEALELERRIPYGNATSVFTRSGALANEVSSRATSGMIGINIGVPVPRDPFSFGGSKDSRFGQGDITGESSLALWSDLKKITSKWSLQSDSTWMTK